MGKFNKQMTAKQAVRAKKGATVNYEGGLAYTVSNKVQLVKQIATSLVGENKFYTSGGRTDSEIISLIHSVMKEDPEFVLKLAVYTREELKLRSAPIVLLGEYANTIGSKGVKNSRKYITRTIQRVDEITELIGYQLNRNLKSPRHSKLPMSIKHGVAQAFNKFSEFQFAKYNRKGNVKLKDALFMTHPKPKDTEQQRIFDEIANDELPTPETWETYISENGSTKETWSHIAPKMSIFALVRNLRNLLENDVPTDLYINKLRDRQTILHSKMLPFRFYSAYKAVSEDVPNQFFAKRDVMDALEDAMQLSISNIKKIPGKTLVLIDVSGSMGWPISQKSSVTYSDISTLFGAMADEICDQAVVGVFASQFKIVNLSRKAPILTKQSELKRINVGGATYAHLGVQWAIDNHVDLDRILIFSDMQAYSSYWGGSVAEDLEIYRRQINHDTYLHSFDLSGYNTALTAEDDPKSNLVAGWSEKIFDYIHYFEKGFGSMVTDVEKVNIE